MNAHVDTLKDEVVKMVNGNYSDAYIEAALYGKFSSKWSITAISKKLALVRKEMTKGKK